MSCSLAAAMLVGQYTVAGGCDANPMDPSRQGAWHDKKDQSSRAMALIPHVAGGLCKQEYKPGDRLKDGW